MTFAHLVRRELPEVVEARQADASIPDTEKIVERPPASWVHLDHSADGSLMILKKNLPPEEADKLQKSRWSIINCWRPIEPISRDPLALCDSRTVPDEDVMLIELGMDTSPNAAATIRANPANRWYYASGMTPDEVMMINIFDTRKDEGLNVRCPHTAFEDARYKHHAPRKSIETRVLVFYEDQSA